MELVLLKTSLNTFVYRLSPEGEPRRLTQRNDEHLGSSAGGSLSLVKTESLNQKDILVSIEPEKAFDSVSTTKLLLKRYQVDVSQKVLLMIHSYL